MTAGTTDHVDYIRAPWCVAISPVGHLWARKLSTAIRHGRGARWVRSGSPAPVDPARSIYRWFDRPAVAPWGSETPIRSCGVAILVDEPIEQVAPPDIARVGRDRLPGRCER